MTQKTDAWCDAEPRKLKDLHNTFEVCPLHSTLTNAIVEALVGVRNTRKFFFFYWLDCRKVHVTIPCTPSFKLSEANEKVLRIKRNIENSQCWNANCEERNKILKKHIVSLWIPMKLATWPRPDEDFVNAFSMLSRNLQDCFSHNYKSWSFPTIFSPIIFMSVTMWPVTAWGGLMLAKFQTLFP